MSKSINSQNHMKHFFHVAISGLVGGVAWLIGMGLFFGSAQAILANPNWQSAKFLVVLEEMDPLPRSVNNISVLIMGLLMIGIIYAIVFSYLEPKFPGNRFQKGIKFGLVSWSLMVPWFEFYLPWNVLHEPELLVLLEMCCWVGVMLLVGISISWTYGFLSSRAKDHR